MRKPVKEIENVLKNHGYSINNIICEFMKTFKLKTLCYQIGSFQQVTMPYLAALTPPNWEVEHIDEGQEKIDFDKEVDLVGITFHTPSADYVYEIVAEFRKRGIPVVLGGPHVSLLPDEAEKLRLLPVLCNENQGHHAD